MARQLTIIHTEASPNWGGQEIRVFGEMISLRARGHRVMIVTPADCPLFLKSQASGIPAIALTFRNNLFLKNLLFLRNLFRRERADVVNPHSSKDGWVASLAARMAGVPLILRSRHIEVDYPKSFLSRHAFTTLPHHVVTTSERIRQRLIHELGVAHNRIDCVPTGVDLPQFDPSLKSRLRSELGLGDSVRIVGMVSVLRSWKGHADFLHAAAQIAKERTEVHFVIAGDGPQRGEIDRKIAELGLEQKVTPLGHREDVANLLAGYDCLVLPSHGREGVPQIVLQAHAMETPVVATRVGGIPEVVTDQKTGLLTPPQNAASLARAIGHVLDDPAAAKARAKAARGFVEKCHSQAVMADHLEILYRRYVDWA
ncbi:MAG: glycosyltransferase family 4 protein [Verrucomicrobiae bacterium]|nr:glycosyltransferase family 4 protein [Verrucomicrobiae bacterium]